MKIDDRGIILRIFVALSLQFYYVEIWTMWILQGMRIVHAPDEFVESFLAAQREAAASFGVNTILLEKYITRPRHIEVQVFMLIFSPGIICLLV